MKRKHLFKFPTSSGPRYRWRLPEDTRAVKVEAFAQGLISATEQKKKSLELSPEAIEAGAISAALLVEKERVKGLQGCNNPVEFRKTFADICTRIWIAILEYWEAEPEIYRSFQRRPPQQRMANARAMAEQYLDPVEQLIADGKPILFDW